MIGLGACMYYMCVPVQAKKTPGSSSYSSVSAIFTDSSIWRNSLPDRLAEFND